MCREDAKDRNAPRKLGHQPPRVAETVFSRLLPARDREPILGDLAEEYRSRQLAEGESHARWWYWRQTLNGAIPALRRRLRRPSRLQRARGRNGLSIAERLGVSWLDLKLGLRMLRKRPVMTASTLFALAVGIPASMVPAHINNVLEAPLPEDPEDRIRAVRYWDQSLYRPVSPTYFDLALWRMELETFSRLAAFRHGVFNLSFAGEQAHTVSGAELTSSSFGLLGAVPAVGRTLQRSDERLGSPDVVVIGYDLWQKRFDGDPDVAGTTVEVGGDPHTIVGVMAGGFLFPSRHQLWLPLREELLSEPAQGRELKIFGRLADGASPADARAEVATLGNSIAAEFPDSNEHLEAEVVRFSTAEFKLPRGGWAAMPDSFLLSVLSLILLGVACANVAMLVFAGTATRFRELSIRTSLGATRWRVVSQLLVECLMLAVPAAGLGLFGFHVLTVWIRQKLLAADLYDFPPYWLDSGVRVEMILGALTVAVLVASVAAGVPALKVTGSRVQESLRKSEAGRSGIRFGGTTSALIVVDVAIAVAVVGMAIGVAGRVSMVLDADDRVGIAADEYLAVELSLPSRDAMASDGGFQPGEFTAQLALTQLTLVKRLIAEPRVSSVAVADRLPRQGHNFRRYSLEGETSWLTVEGRPGATAPPLLPVARVDVDFFDALGQPILSGRGFDQADLSDSASTAIVNTSFAERRLGGLNPVGRRFRFWVGSSRNSEPEERWYEIVGVVGPLGINVAMPEQDAGIYLPAAPGEIHPLRLAVHVTGSPETFTTRLHEIVNQVEPKAVLKPAQVLDSVVQGVWYFYLGSIACLMTIVGILVALAASGIYAIMSFSVSERTREIGIRRSLGEQKGALAMRICRRSLAQISVGAVLGIWPAMQLYRLTELGYVPPTATDGLTVAVAAGIGVALVIGAISCISPTHRALRINPLEALRAEG